jgi:aspartyl-tRNA(Asn)/glutamyl-tRNA(Gln) amidotransferase subunit A
MKKPDLKDLSRSIGAHELSPMAVLEEFFALATQHNGELNAFIRIDETSARANAELLGTQASAGEFHGPLHGIPIAIKDLIDIAGAVTSCASHLFEHNVAVRDADVIRRLRAAGAVFSGKTNLHEFAYGGSGMISCIGPARNPWDTRRITGGSSSGSAAAIGAGIAVAAIGTDTAGSIRLPASFCGIVGFKPSYGRVSTEGVVPLSESYDHVGPMTRTVADARIVFEAISGETSPAVSPQVEGLRIGIPETYFFRDLETDVGKILSAAMGELEKAGHRLIAVDFPVDEDRTVASAEAYAYHARWVEKSPELYQPETLRRIRSGEKVSREAYLEAQSKLAKMRGTAGDIFTNIDVLLTPTVPVLPPKIDDLLAEMDKLRHRELIMLRNTRPFNVLGIPAINIPWDLSSEGLPVGVQLAAAPGKDFELLAIAEEFEKISPWQGCTSPGFD